MVLPELLFLFFFIFKILFIHERHRERERQREKQAPFREPNVGLDPRTPGSQPELKDAQPLSHPGVLVLFIIQGFGSPLRPETRPGLELDSWHTVHV